MVLVKDVQPFLGCVSLGTVAVQYMINPQGINIFRPLNKNVDWKNIKHV